MLDQRYRYDARGEYARDYSQRPAHPANIGLRLAISYGLEVHGELAGRKFNDVTLENALGAGAASLLWDGVEFDELALMAGVGRAQSYRDALRATFERIQELRVLDTDSSFIEEFCGQLELRGLLDRIDVVLRPEVETAHSALIDLVREDLLSLAGSGSAETASAKQADVTYNLAVGQGSVRDATIACLRVELSVLPCRRLWERFQRPSGSRP